MRADKERTRSSCPDTHAAFDRQRHQLEGRQPIAVHPIERSAGGVAEHDIAPLAQARIGDGDGRPFAQMQVPYDSIHDPHAEFFMPFHKMLNCQKLSGTGAGHDVA